MLNEDKIKLMASIALFEKKEGKYTFVVNRYFKSDYIGRNMVRSFIGYTFCWLLGLFLLFLYKAEDIFSVMSLEELQKYGEKLIIGYVAGLVVYLAVTVVVYFIKYNHGVQGMKVYMAKLRRLEKRYEFQNRAKELGREVKRHDRNAGV